jgi:hypothetical protein
MLDNKEPSYPPPQIDPYFTDEGRKHILRTIDIFKHFEVVEGMGNMKIDGKVFGDDTAPYIYFMFPIKDGFEVQLFSKKDLSMILYMFGICFTKTMTHVYHNGHGPFNIFGFEYEKHDI